MIQVSIIENIIFMMATVHFCERHLHFPAGFGASFPVGIIPFCMVEWNAEVVLGEDETVTMGFLVVCGEEDNGTADSRNVG
jgi:hypothetical protein